MSRSSKEMLKWLRVALDYENEGLDLYTRAAAGATNPLSRRLFRTLASQEIEHAKRIEEVYSLVEQGKKLPASEKLKRIGGHIDLEKDIRDFFKSVDKTSLRDDIGNVEAMKVALKIEKKSLDLYSELAKEAGTASEREFLSALKKEEQKHMDALDNVYYYLTDPEMWFSKDESRVWNWMGT
jgi:rubrerythrin